VKLLDRARVRRQPLTKTGHGTLSAICYTPSASRFANAAAATSISQSHHRLPLGCAWQRHSGHSFVDDAFHTTRLPHRSTSYQPVSVTGERTPASAKRFNAISLWRYQLAFACGITASLHFSPVSRTGNADRQCREPIYFIFALCLSHISSGLRIQTYDANTALSASRFREPVSTTAFRISAPQYEPLIYASAHYAPPIFLSADDAAAYRSIAADAFHHFIGLPNWRRRQFHSRFRYYADDVII